MITTCFNIFISSEIISSNYLEDEEMHAAIITATNSVADIDDGNSNFARRSTIQQSFSEVISGFQHDGDSYGAGAAGISRELTDAESLLSHFLPLEDFTLAMDDREIEFFI